MITVTTKDICYGILCCIIATYIARRGYKKGSLSKTGAIGAFIVGSISLFSHIIFGTLLLVFYFTGSAFTKYKAHIKELYDNDIDNHNSTTTQEKKLKNMVIKPVSSTSISTSLPVKGGGNRGIIQVFSTAGTGIILASIHLYWYYTDELYYQYINSNPWLCIPVHLKIYDFDEPFSKLWLLILAYLGNFACVCGDTWASELGILSTNVPYLITYFGFLKVPRGTNGGVSILGFIYSGLGGLCMGCTLYFMITLLSFLYSLGIMNISSSTTTIVACSLWDSLYIIPLSGILGLCGSIIDSFLGAIVQRTWYYPLTGKVSCYPPDITNNQDKTIYKRIPYNEDMLDISAWSKKYEYNTKQEIPYVIISGYPILTNELVNLCSATLTAYLTLYFGFIYHIWYFEV